MTRRPSLTILLAANPTVDDLEKARKLLDDQAETVSFLNPRTKLIDNIASFNDYSRFCVLDLASCFDTDFVLIVQLDGKILNPNAWCDEFLDYDYVGAPWQEYGWLRKKLEDMGQNKDDLDFRVGNGGFSLRSRKLCEAVKKHSDIWVSENEDTFISLTLRDCLEHEGMKFAPYEVAKRFSVERDVYENQFGAHKWIFKGGKQISIKSL